MARKRQVLLRVLVGLVALVVIPLAVGVLIITRTDWGRERVRAFAVGQLANSVNGRVSVGHLDGTLLSGAVLENVMIEDSTGAPFLKADTIAMRYSLRSFLSKELIFRDVVVVRPVIVLDQEPGGEWNFMRLFPQDTTMPADTTGGFSRIRFEDLRIRDGTAVVRMAWSPPDSVRGDARREAIRAELAGETRNWVVKADGGYQRLSIVSHLDAALPLVRLADPDSTAQVFDIESASMIAFPFRPPAARIRDVKGRVALTEDSAFIQELQIALPASWLVVEGTYAFESGELRSHVTAQPLDFADLRWVRPDLPAGGGRIRTSVALAGRSMRIVADEMHLAVESGSVAGEFDVLLGDTLQIGEADLVLAGIDTRTLERLAGGATVPVSGVIDGTLGLTGTPERLQVDGSVEFRERSGSVSRVIAGGAIGSAENGGIMADALRLRFDPIRSSLLRQMNPGLPIDGTLSGTTTLSGTMRGGLEVAAQLAHDDPEAGRSHLTASGGVALDNAVFVRDMRVRIDSVQVAAFDSVLPAGGILAGTAVVNGSPSTSMQTRIDLTHTAETGDSRATGTFSFSGGQAPALTMDLALPILSLSTIGSLAPASQLHGNASGSLRASGPLTRLVFDLGLEVDEGGAITANGTLDRRQVAMRYDLRAALANFDAARVRANLPATRLSGQLALRGQGTDPATLEAALEASLVDPDTTGEELDSTRVLVNIADGLLRVDRGQLRLASAAADLEGSFGLVSGRSGELRYDVVVHDLRDFAGYIPGDTTAVPPRPVAQARRIAAARAEAREAEVRRRALQQPPAPLDIDSLSALQRDSVAGSLYAEGTVTGSIAAFDVSGTARADHIVAAGSTIGSAQARYQLNDFLTPDADLVLDADIDSLRVAGFAFDSASADLRYRGVRNQGEGTLALAFFPDPVRDYRLVSDFRIELDRREVTFNELALRFDTVQWTAPRAGTLSWEEAGVTVDSLLLTTRTTGGRILLDGSLPAEGESDLLVQLERVPIEQFGALLQDTGRTTGLVSLDTRIRGTRLSPRFEGDASLLEAFLESRPLPDLRASFDYADQELHTTAELTREDLPLMQAEARLPINLAISGVSGPRMLDRPLHIEMHADSIPLEAMPSFTDAAADVRGLLRGDVTVTGTFDAPAMDGTLNLDVETLNVVPAGLALRNITGTARFEGATVHIDSITVSSGEGPIRLAGDIDVESLTRPAFDLSIDADEALVLDNANGRVRASAHLTVTGPIDSARIAGDAEVTEGVIHVPDMNQKRITQLDDPTARAALEGAAADSDAVPSANPLMQNMQVDIGLRVGRNTWVRNLDGNVEVYTPEGVDPLRIRMNVEEPGLSLDGIINADRGEYTFAGRVFEMTTGSVTFVPGAALDPLLQLNALYEVPRRGREALVIQIHLTGTLSQPRIALASSAEPPMSESDLLSYLAFGRSSSSILNLSDAGLSGGGGDGGGIGAMAQQQLASLALGGVVDQAFSNLERTGSRALDIFRVHPAELPEELAFNGQLGNFLRGTQVVAGKYLTSRLFLAAEGRTTTEAWPGFRVEYTQEDGFSWLMTWEPMYLPVQPSLEVDQSARSTRVFGTFLFWSRRF